MGRIVVLRYAKALFSVAAEKNQIDEYNEAVKGVLAILADEENQLLAVINHLSISAAEKMTTMRAIFEGKLPEDFIGFFELVFKRGRQADLVAILQQFGLLYKEHKRIASAKLYSADEMPQEKLAEIAEILGKKLDKTIEFELVIDTSLIAGFRVDVDGFVFDSSLKAQLGQMKKQLLTGGRHTVLP